MIRYLLVSALSLGLTACATAETVPASQPALQGNASVQLLVLGTYHFDNPGLDLINPVADDVLTDRRQSELEELARRLAEFRPTAIAIERVRKGDSFLDTRFAEFTPADLRRDRNEIVQIGYRVAHEMGIDRVYAVDVQKGELEFFPFNRIQSFAEKTGQAHLIGQKIAEVQAEVNEMARDQETLPMHALLARENDPERTRRMHADFYYGLLNFADAEDQPGAALNYGWYARNALIFSNIAASSQPGDRILVVYGSGHNYWLQHFAETAPGFEFVDPRPYLSGQATASAAANGS